jgi:hypothetical protein
MKGLLVALGTALLLGTGTVVADGASTLEVPSKQQQLQLRKANMQRRESQRRVRDAARRAEAARIIVERADKNR